ncbi:MAG: hypothetical protein AAGM22_07980 [Acidobacteriota bacterium]
MKKLALISTLGLLIASGAFAVSSAPYNLEPGGSQTVIDDAPADGPATAENWGPDTVVFTVEENVGGTWRKKMDFPLKKGQEKDFEIKKGQRVKVRTLSRSRTGDGAKGRIVVPWD